MPTEPTNTSSNATPTPEEIAFYEKNATQAPSEVNPLRDLSADDIFSLATQDPDNFHIASEFSRNKDLWGDQNFVQKVADVNRRIKDRGFQVSDIPGVGRVLRTGFDIAKGFGKQAWNYTSALAVNPALALVGDITGQGPGFSKELAQQGQQQVMENIAGTEQAVTGLARMGEKLVNKAVKSAAAYSGQEITTTPEQRVKDLFDDVGALETEQEIAKGKGGFLEPVGGEVRKELESAGKPVRPEEVQQLAAGDPLSFYTFGKAFQGVNKIVPPKVGQVVEKVAEKAGQATETATGRAIQAAGALTELGGKTAQIFGPTAGAIVGTLKAGPFGTLVGEALGRRVQGAARKVAAAGEKLQTVGKEIAGATPVTTGATQLAKDVVGAVPMAAAEVGKGLTFDLGTAALTSESPQDTQSVGIGAFFGGANALRRTGARIISGQIVGPRAWGSDNYVPPSGKVDQNFENMHIDALKTATPAVRTRLNAVREFLKGSNADTDVFLAKDAPSLEKALTSAGMDPQNAKIASEQEGFFQANIPGKDGTPRRVIFARNVDAAPHEAFHAIQDVLGEDANQMIDQIVRQEYGDQWEAEGQRYASRIDPNTPDWRETILDTTGTGLDYAKEKIAMDVANEYRNTTGAEPPSKYVQDRAKEIFGQTMDRALQANPDVDPNQIASRVWRDVLSPQEATAVADTYLSRELAAENFDAVFKNLGASLNVQGLTGRLARVVANLASTLGIEPLSPERVSQIGKVAPKFAVTEAVRKAPGMVQPRAETLPKPSLKGPLILPSPSKVSPEKPVSPEQPVSPPAEKPEVNEAREFAAEASDKPVAAGTESPREVLGKVAEAIAQQAGIKVNYLSAPDEPAAAISSNRDVRRAIIETFRTMPPETRALWEKNFFPERVIKLKGDKFQVMGWAPEVFASNAHKLAAKLTELGVAESSPYPIENGTFTTEGWKQLFEDTQKFVKNQIGGRTGAGEPLVVPKGLPGVFAPPEKGRPVALEQGKADFINMLFGFKLPETARLQKGKLPLNIAGQAVSEATKPGRTEVPVIPRGAFEGAEAQRQGIAGQSIKEVNPLRQQIEAAAQARGVAMPEFIEAIQRLNLENIKDVQVAPELPQFRANTLTLSAGFQPKGVTEKPKPSEIIFRPGWLSPKGEFFSLGGFPTHDHWAVANIDNLPGIKIPNNWTGTSIELLQRNGWMRFTPFRGDSAIIDSGLSRKFPTKAQRDALEDWAINDPDLKKVFLDRAQEGIGGNEQPETLWSREEGPHAFQFQPSPAERAVKSAAVKDERGKVWEGFWHGSAEEKARDVGAKGPFADGFTTNTPGEFLTREEAFQRAKELGQIAESAKPGAMDEQNRPGLENSQLMGPKLKVQFQPEQQAKDVAKMTPEEFDKWAHETPGGLTETAYQVGLNAPSQAFVNFLKAAEQSFAKKALESINTNPEQGMILAAQQQFFNEAWQAATGEGSAGFALRKEKPGYQPKFPLDKSAQTDETAAVKFQPKEFNKATGSQFQPPTPEEEAVGKRMDQRLRAGAGPGRHMFEQARRYHPLNLELEKIREGDSGGQTFTKTGDVWNPGDRKSDIVTLASINVPTKDLTPEKFREAIAPYKELLSDDVVAGVFKLSDGENSSIDINAVVPQEHRDNTVQFAKDNDQQAIWDAVKNDVVSTGGSGDTKLKTVEQIKEALPNLLAGKPVQFQPKESEEKRFPTKRELAAMTPEQLGEFYPEAVIPKTSTEPIASDIKGSPLFKKAIDEDAAVKIFGDKLAEFARENKDNPLFKMGREWYEDFTPQLKKEFGADAQLFAELLAATSPQTSVSTNFGYAVDAVESFRRGRFTKIMAKFNEGLGKIEDGSWKKWYEREKEAGRIPKPPKKPTAATFMAAWIAKHNLKPKQTNGSLYGTHSLPVLQVFARQWLKKARGPKTLNFVENLLGTSDEATIDLWADRTMRRIGYEGEQRWRILPKNIKGVSDADFEFSQRAFRHAATQLGLRPSALQAALWFVEKDLWSQNGWSKLDLGDFREQMRRLPTLRKGIEERLGKSKQKQLKIESR